MTHLASLFTKTVKRSHKKYISKEIKNEQKKGLKFTCVCACVRECMANVN